MTDRLFNDFISDLRTILIDGEYIDDLQIDMGRRIFEVTVYKVRENDFPKAVNEFRFAYNPDDERSEVEQYHEWKDYELCFKRDEYKKWARKHNIRV